MVLSENIDQFVETARIPVQAIAALDASPFRIQPQEVGSNQSGGESFQFLLFFRYSFGMGADAEPEIPFGIGNGARGDQAHERTSSADVPCFAWLCKDIIHIPDAEPLCRNLNFFRLFFSGSKCEFKQERRFFSLKVFQRKGGCKLFCLLGGVFEFDVGLDSFSGTDQTERMPCFQFDFDAGKIAVCASYFKRQECQSS